MPNESAEENASSDKRIASVQPIARHVFNHSQRDSVATVRFPQSNRFFYGILIPWIQDDRFVTGIVPAHDAAIHAEHSRGAWRLFDANDNFHSKNLLVGSC